MYSQDMQFTYNVIPRRVGATIVVVEKQLVLHTVSIRSHRYRACNAHAPYCHMWAGRLY